MVFWSVLGFACLCRSARNQSVKIFFFLWHGKTKEVQWLREQGNWQYDGPDNVNAGQQSILKRGSGGVGEICDVFIFFGVLHVGIRFGWPAVTRECR